MLIREKLGKFKFLKDLNEKLVCIKGLLVKINL